MSQYTGIAQRARATIARKGAAVTFTRGGAAVYNLLDDATVEQRFWAKVKRGTPTECWLWTASIGTSGYGQIGVGGRRGRPIGAHRISWELHYGPIPTGMWVLHRCDVRTCVNPTHFFLGTATENNADMKAKGRYVGPRSLWTHCKHGHSIDKVWGNGERYCGTCHMAKVARQVAEKAKQRALDPEPFRARDRASHARRQERRRQVAA